MSASGVNWVDLAVLSETGVNWVDLGVLSKAGVNWSDLQVLSETGVNWSDLDVLSKSGVNWVDLGVLSESGVNWVDLGVMSQAGVNWVDLGVMSETGVNWVDFGVLSRSGVNWVDLGVMSEAGVNWVDLGVLSKTGVNWADLQVLSETGVNWSDFEMMSTAGVNWVDLGVLSETGVNWNDLEVLEIKYKGQSVSDVLEMTVSEAAEFFKNVPAIARKMDTLVEVGLGYIKLGQPATTFSGGEAQRIKLATELSRRATGKTLYILDEPTTGLHSDDVNRLLGVLQKLVSTGNSMIIIEHNLDVIKNSDWVIEMGPEGGELGGAVVYAGRPEGLKKVKESWTGKYLKEVLSRK
jgi:hypothetical protein